MFFISILRITGHLLTFFSLFFVADLASAVSFKRAHTSVDLVTESQTIKAGQTVAVALTLSPIPHWHTYWQNPGDSGLATDIQWTLPKGFKAGGLAFPPPGIIRLNDIVNFAYDGPLTLLGSITAPADFDRMSTKGIGPILLKSTVSWLVCSDEQCVPEQADLALSLQPGDGKPEPAQAVRFAKARALLPQTVAWPSQFSVSQGTVTMHINWGVNKPTLVSAQFYPLTPAVLVNGAPQTLSVDGNSLWISAKALKSSKIPDSLSGVLTVKTSASAETEAFTLNSQLAPARLDVPANATPAQLTNSSDKPLGLFAAVGLAFMGGIILNLMPCVFPILSLKALALAKAGHSPAKAKNEALAYTAGVILSFAALGGLLLILRSLGQTIGWGFQLQNPWIVGGLALMIFVIGLNLLGVFEISTRFAGSGQSLTQKDGLAGPFWTGVLAVLVASPCTAPFMAGALGAAVVLPAIGGLMIFVFLGLGLALPFLLIGFMPALQRRLPKPGAWMLTFRKLLAVPMFMTAAWLGWVLYQQVGPATAATATTALNEQAYSETKLASLLADRKPTFVYFTADWCLTCKVNEHSTLHTDAVATALKKHGVTVLVGDWTRKDAAIAGTLAKYGRSGVPLYLYFKPGATTETPEILPQVLTPDAFVKTLGG